MDIITVSPTKTATSLVIPGSAWPLAADTNKIIIRIADTKEPRSLGFLVETLILALYSRDYENAK